MNIIIRSGYKLPIVLWGHGSPGNASSIPFLGMMSGGGGGVYQPGETGILH